MEIKRNRVLSHLGWGGSKESKAFVLVAEWTGRGRITANEINQGIICTFSPRPPAKKGVSLFFSPLGLLLLFIILPLLQPQVTQHQWQSAEDAC